SGMFTIPQTTKNEVKPLKLSGKKDVNLLYSLSQKNTINAIHPNKEKTAFSGQVSLPDQVINEVLSVTGNNNPVAEDHFEKTFLSERGIHDVKSNINNSLSNADDHEKELLPERVAYHSGVMQDNSNTPQVNINSLNKKPVENRKQPLNKKKLIPIDSDHNTNAIKDFSYYFSRLTNNSKVIIRYDDAR
ncbi:hypothetical protein, partial [Methanosarcina mazei]|uniref:hypothetical protein n=1 Tax=Methanosarcina mazei TaxID=2209 RepID=UPI00138E0F18